MRGHLVALLAVTLLASCKPKLHAVTVEERIVADAHKAGRLPNEALNCQVFLSGSLSAKVVELRDDYSGVVYLRTTEASPRCDGEFSFRFARAEEPTTTRTRYSDLDIGYWEIVELKPLPSR